MNPYQLQGRIKRTCELLTCVLGREVSVLEEYEILINSNYRLRDLLTLQK